jgi:hypothetical protein
MRKNPMQMMPMFPKEWQYVTNMFGSIWKTSNVEERTSNMDVEPVDTTDVHHQR